jgi:SAM-dependent methyltransferase
LVFRSRAASRLQESVVEKRRQTNTNQERVLVSQAKSFNKEKAEKFTLGVVNDLAAAVHGAMTYIGDKLGIFKAMAASGPVTSAELSRATGLNERYLREWLGSMAAAQYVEYDPESRRYLLPAEHAAPLANENSPVFLGGFFQSIIANVSVAAKVAEAFKTGKGVPQSEYPAETFEAIERTTAPWYKNHLVRKWVPLMPQVKAKLEAGGTALDVGCGSGRAAIELSKGFPAARVFGFDNHGPSIERARANAQAEGVGDRVKFELVDCTRLPQREFDFISTFDVVHDSVDPAGLLSSIRKALAKDGTYLMLEINASDKVEQNISPMGRMLYSISTLYCMTVSLAHGGAGIGALMGEQKARELVEMAGFGNFRKLATDDQFSVLYEIRA